MSKAGLGDPYYPQSIVVPRTRLIFLRNISQTDNILSSYKQFFTSLDFGSQDLITRQMLDAVVPGTGSAQWSYPSLTEIIIVAEVLENCSKS